MKKLLSLALVAAGLALVPTVARADIIIDNFEDAKAPNSDPQRFYRLGTGAVAPAPNNEMTATPGLPAIVRGGEREVDMTISPIGGGAVAGQIDVDLDVASGRFVFSTSSAAGRTNVFEIVYDGPGAAGLGAAGNFGAGSAFEFLGRTDANAPLAGTLEVEDNNSSSTAGFLVPNLAVGTFGTITIPFSAFAGIDFSKVKSLVFTFNTANIGEADTQIDDIIVREPPIPEPASLAILTACLAGAGGVHLIRRRKAVK